MTKAHLIVLGLIAGLLVWLFADALFGAGVFVFRDAGHYYYPLFQFVRSEWQAGRVPLWNPYENLGVPLAGNATTSVFYPGTLIFLLPLDYAWAYKLYVMSHVLLAAGAAYRLARHWQASVEAAGMAAVSYAFCGNVLFQYCNVVFLVGAAWLPLAVLAADMMLMQASGARGQESGHMGQGSGARGEGRGGLRWAIAFGVVLALMTLGGNAEMAYHAGLMAAIYAVWLWWYECRASGGVWRPHIPPTGGSAGRLPISAKITAHSARTAGPTSSRIARIAASRPALLAIAALAGLALSAVQVLPSVEFTRRSGRVASSVPRTIYELPSHLLSGKSHPRSGAGLWSDGLTCRRLKRGTHHEHVYDFSVGPWRLVEYVWPNVSGRQFPTHRRWLEVIPAEGRIWVPSFYMGLVPLVLALSAMQLRRAKARETWLSWMVVLAVVASFGQYGLGWLVHQIRAAAGADVSSPWLVGPPCGGLYWLMTVVLPGYIYFRYPAKLLVIAALGLSMLAAVGWDRALAEPSALLRRRLLWLSAFSLLGAVLAVAVRPFWQGWLAGVEPDMLFGPLDTPAAGNDLLAAFLQTAIVSGLFWWLLGRIDGLGARGEGDKGRGIRGEGREIRDEGLGVRDGKTRPSRLSPLVPRPSSLMLLLVAVDLAVANRWMVACGPADQWQETSRLAAEIAGYEGRWGDGQPFRVYRRPLWMPPAWKSHATPQRLVEAMSWDRDTLWPKYNLRAGLAVAEVLATLAPLDYEALLRFARSCPSDIGPGVPARWFLHAVNARYVILRGQEAPTGDQPMALVWPPIGGRSAIAHRMAGDKAEDCTLWWNRGHLPRAWIVHRVELLPPLSTDDVDQLRERTEEVFCPHGVPRDLGQWAVVETDSQHAREMRGSGARGQGPGIRVQKSSIINHQSALTTHHSARTATNNLPPIVGESCRVTRYDPLEVEIEARLERPGLVILCDQFYPGWRLEVVTEGQGRRTVSILRANRVMRGAWLPAGNHRLIYRYVPTSFLCGAAVSGIAWLGLAMMLVAAGRRQRGAGSGQKSRASALVRSRWPPDPRP